MIRPSVVTGNLSPLPPVVTVAMAHQSASPAVLMFASGDRLDVENGNGGKDQERGRDQGHRAKNSPGPVFKKNGEDELHRTGAAQNPDEADHGTTRPQRKKVSMGMLEMKSTQPHFKKASRFSAR